MSAPPLAAPKSKKRAPPKLAASAFLLPTPSSKRLYPHSILDTHIHLWTPEQLNSANVVWPRRSQYPQLREEHTLEQYDAVVQGGVKHLGGAPGETTFRGAVFVQAEAEHDDEDLDGTNGGWHSAIDEVDAVCKAALTCSTSPTKILALVPWAPVHLGPQALTTYFTHLRSLPSLTSSSLPIPSCRYLLQDSPPGFFLSDTFIAGLKWLGEKGIAFDLTVDCTQQEGVLDDVLEVVRRVREGQEQARETRFILDHFCKPPLIPSPTFPPSAQQTNYITSLFSLSLLSNVSLKLSGLLDSAEPHLVAEAFDEFKKGEKKGDAGQRLKGRVLTFLEPALEAFGEERIMVGSDWPMFRAKTISLPSPLPSPSPSSSSPSAPRNAEEESLAWAFEMTLYRTCLVELGLHGEGLDSVFEGNARRFYGI